MLIGWLSVFIAHFNAIAAYGVGFIILFLLVHAYVDTVPNGLPQTRADDPEVATPAPTKSHLAAEKALASATKALSDAMPPKLGNFARR